MNELCVDLAWMDVKPVGATIGGKAAGLAALREAGFPTLPGIVVTAEAFDRFLAAANLQEYVARLDRLDPLSPEDHPPELIAKIRTGILSAALPTVVQTSLAQVLDRASWSQTPLAVRSSCTAEDGRDVSFAGIYESYLNVSRDQLEEHVRRCYASVYTERAIAYALKHRFKASELRMAVVIQPAIDAVAAGVAFTAEPETGCDKNALIESVFGLGAGLVSGEVSPDVFVINKKTGSVIRRILGDKGHRYAFDAGGGTRREANSAAVATRFSLLEEDLKKLFEMVCEIETKMMDRPVDVEWAKTPQGDMVILQARPLQMSAGEAGFIEYTLEVEGHDLPIVTGQPITDKVVVGRVRLATDGSMVASRGEVIVARHIDVDWTPRLRHATAVVTEGGGYTSHIAIILREMGIPALFGAEHAFEKLEEDALVTVACNRRPGGVWLGQKPYHERRIDLASIYRPRTKVHLVTSALGGLDQALRMPVNGIGLVRLEFLISNAIGIHPRAILDAERGQALPDPVRAAVRDRMRSFASPSEYYVETLCEAVCAFASRCPEKVVNVRFADLLSDDYLSLVGGELYETERESNPMLGWRGTSRLIDPDYVDAFTLDCLAFRKAIEEKGFDNMTLMLPFCRTPEDAAVAIEHIRKHGPRHAPIGMMVEIPSNIALADEFADLVDYFLIGPMDLTQLTYGADRKSRRLSRYSDATAATREMVKFFLEKIRGRGKRVFVGGWPLFQYLEEYLPRLTNNELLLVELPDRLPELFANLRRLEAKVYGAAAAYADAVHSDTPALDLRRGSWNGSVPVTLCP